MTRISDNRTGSAQLGSTPPDAGNAQFFPAAASSLTTADLRQLLEGRLTPDPSRPHDLGAISGAVVDWWMHQNVPGRLLGDPQKQRLREQLVDALRDDPTFQSMIEKLAKQDTP